MTALLGVPVLAWFALSLVAFSVAFGLLLGKVIHGAEAPVFKPISEPRSAADLDDWLALDGVEFDFKVSKRPSASVTVDGGVR